MLKHTIPSHAMTHGEKTLQPSSVLQTTSLILLIILISQNNKTAL